MEKKDEQDGDGGRISHNESQKFIPSLNFFIAVDSQFTLGVLRSFSSGDRNLMCTKCP